MRTLQTFESFAGIPALPAPAAAQELIQHIQQVLTPDLLRGMWRRMQDPANPMLGHCYAGTEALYWLLGGPESGYTPYVLGHRNAPSVLAPGETHWFLRHTDGTVLDVTAAQFGSVEIPYATGIANGMMQHPWGGSKRALEIMRRVRERQG